MDSDKRFQVFISSTFLDLVNERSAVVSALLSLDAFPAGMELFPAADDDAWSLIEDVIQDSDYYLLIIGGKYGSIDSALDISYTEREYDTAVSLGKPIMAFLHGDTQDLKVSQSESDPTRTKKLTEFRDKVKSAKHVKYWSNAEDLAGKVALSWNTFRRRYPATGWIRADQATSTESLEALTKARGEIDALKGQLQEVRTQAPEGTESLAQGDSLFTLPIKVVGHWVANGAGQRRNIENWTRGQLTWDEAFGYLGLRMMQEGSESDLKEDVTRLATDQNFTSLSEAFDKAVESSAEKATKAVSSKSFTGVEIDDEEFQTILLQFTALGLIAQPSKVRSVKDPEKYWTLTPYGRMRLQQIRALQSGETRLNRQMDTEQASTVADK